MNLLLLTHLYLTLFMTGLCWFVQIVHYPLFHYIGKTEFTRYERKNMITGWITIPMMFLEMITAIVLLIWDFNLIYIINLSLILMTGISTIIYQVPLHLQLGKKASKYSINKLIKTNWIRTFSWTCRSILLGIMLLNSL